MVLVDYADLLKASISRKEKRDELETIYEELRSLAKENLSPLWTVSQLHRAGYNLEIPSVENIAEAFSKIFVCDLVCTLGRTLEDKIVNGRKNFDC